MTAQTQPEALQMAIRSMIQEAARQRARIAELESEVTTKTKQINALQLLQSSQMARMLDLQDQVAPAKEAIATLQSERDANARLTQEIEQLREKRQPLSDEQIKGVLEIVKTVIACVNEAHHAKSEGWRDGCFASADSAYSRIEPYLREIGIEEQS